MDYKAYITLLQCRVLAAVDDGRAWARDAYELGYADGFQAGYLDARLTFKKIERAIYRALGGRP